MSSIRTDDCGVAPVSFRSLVHVYVYLGDSFTDPRALVTSVEDTVDGPRLVCPLDLPRLLAWNSQLVHVPNCLKLLVANQI